MQNQPQKSTPWAGIIITIVGLVGVTAIVCSGMGALFGAAFLLNDSPAEPPVVIADFDPEPGSVQLRATEPYADPAGYGMVLELVATDGAVLPMFIGTAEAEAISWELAGIEMPRPMTHDLLVNVIDGLGGQLEGVMIRKVDDNAFHAALFVEQASGTTVQIDSRSSDAVAVALRAGVPIYAAPGVMDYAVR